MGKIWDFDGNGKDYVTDVSKLLFEYKDGLNKQQKELEANIDYSINSDGEAIIKLYVSGSNIRHRDIFIVEVKFNGLFDLTIHYYDLVKEEKSLTLKDLECVLDDVVKSEKMGLLIAHLIKIAKFTP